MKKSITLFFSITIVVGIVFTENILQNSEPLNEHAGRVIKLKKVLTIDDVGDEYYFRYPRMIKISPEGSLFILDREQLIQFDLQGNFIRDFFKKGRGPGEMEKVSNFCFHKDKIIVHDRRLNKVLWFNLDGKLAKEFRIYETTGLVKFILFYNDRYYFSKTEIPLIKGEPRIVDCPHQIFSLREEDKVNKLTSFPTKNFVAVFKGARGSLGINRLIVTPYKKKFLFISHTPEYLIKLYDIEKNKVIRKFQRDYKRVKTPSRIKREKSAYYVKLMGKKFTRPPQKYLNDIRNLFVIRDKLWVLTSKTHQKKGVLVDVFDLKGRYLDNFYLKFPEEITPNLFNLVKKFQTMAFHNNFLFIIERNKDKTLNFVKYKFEN